MVEEEVVEAEVVEGGGVSEEGMKGGVAWYEVGQWSTSDERYNGGEYSSLHVIRQRACNEWDRIE